jgi:predicted nuclease of predicted toxin-antitoxin system
VRLLLDEMYSPTLADALRTVGIDAVTVAGLGLSGRSDLDLFAAAVADDYVVLTENVADFARIAAEHVTAGQHHPGVLIALSSRFSRCSAGRAVLVTAVRAAVQEPLQDRVVYLER